MAATGKIYRLEARAAQVPKGRVYRLEANAVERFPVGKIYRLEANAVETFPTGKVYRLSASAVENFPRGKVYRLSATATQATINLGGNRSVHAGDFITVTAAVSGASSVTWTQTGGPTVIRADSALTTVFRAPVELEPSIVTIQAVTNGGAATAQIATRSAPVSYWDGTTNRAATIEYTESNTNV